MKCIRKADKSAYVRISNSEAERLVDSGKYVYTTKSAFKSFFKRTRKRIRNFKEFPGERTMRVMRKNSKKSEISNGNSTKKTKKTIQRITDKPKKIFVEKYLPKSALRKIKAKLITKKEAMITLAKNRYVNNVNIKIVKTIKHRA